MPDLVSFYRDAGFSDDEIAAHLTEKRERLKAGGFSDQEVDDYFGMPRTPEQAPQSFIDRLDLGAKIGRVLSGFGKGFTEGMGTEPYGLSLEADEQLRTKLPMFNALWGPEVRTIAGGIDAVNRLMSAGVTGVAEAIGQAAEEAGEKPGMAARLKRDVTALAQVAPFARDGVPIMRLGRVPGGQFESQPIGRLPTGQDIMDAGRAIGNGDTTPAIEAKLTRLYEDHGIHPAEVAHDAQTDPVVAQSILSSDPQDLPQRYIEAFHGSGAKFERFSDEFIGTGEGNQSFGYGHYVAENEATGERYLPSTDTEEGNAVRAAQDYMRLAKGDRERAVSDAAEHIADLQGELSNEELDKEDVANLNVELRDAKRAQELLRSGEPLREGYLYRVRINADPEHFLDYDRPLNEQGERTTQALDRLRTQMLDEARQQNIPTPQSAFMLEDKKIDLETFLKQADRDFGEVTTAEMMRDAGIPGIRYLDQGSRAEGEGTRNYVVFDPNKIEITHRNGVPLEKPLHPGEAGAPPMGPPRMPPPGAGTPPPEPPPYSDAEKTILSKISVGKKSPQAKLTWGDLYTRTIDKLFPISKAVKGSALDLTPEDNPYALARLMSGHVGKADHFLNQSTFDFNTYESNGKSLKEALAPVADDLNGFFAYAASRRTMELEERGIKHGFDLPSAARVVADGATKYEKPFRELVDYQNRVSQYLRDAGVLSEAGYKAMLEANQQYVPFFRIMGLDPNARMRGGSSLQARNPIKAIKGSARDIVDPLESVVRNTYHFVEMAERNQVGTKLVDMLTRASAELPDAPAAAERTETTTGLAKPISEALSEAGVKGGDALAESLAHAAEPVRKGDIAVLRDGKRETYKVDPDLARAMKGLDAQSMGLLEKVLAYPASVLRAGAVTTPDFALRHTIRDFLYAATTFRGGVFTPIDMAKGFTGLIMKDEDYWNWLKGGGGNVSMVGMDRQYLQADLRKLTGETGLVGRAWNVLADPEASMWEKAGATGKLPFQAIDKFVLDPLRALTQMAESASHLGAFKKTMRASEPEATDLRSQIIRAAWQSRDTAVDAARMGANMRAYNMITAFANIKLQDTDRVVRAIKDNPIGSLTKIGAAITVPSVILWAANHDDPRYAEIPQWQKDLFWIVMTPDHIFRVPKPWAMGMIFGTGPERLLDAFAAQKPEAFRDYAKDLYAASGPDFIPTAASPIIDQFANRSTFTNRTLIPAEQEKFLPEYQYTPYTTELAKRVGEIIGSFPGMEARVGDGLGGPVARAISSPVLMENYIRGWTGTLGVYALQAADAGLRKSGVLPDPPQPASTLADIPFIKAFVVRYPSASAQSIQDFYDEYGRNKTYFDTFMAKAQEGDQRAMARIQEMGGPMMFMQLDGIQQTLGEHSKLIRDLYKNPEIAPDEKRQLIDQLYYSEIQVAHYGMDAMRQMRAVSRETVPAP